jgi:hypothetical protein
MRKKLETKEQIEKKKKRNNYLLASILILVTFGSVFGVVVNFISSSNKTSNEKITYGGLEFQNAGSYYTLTLGDKVFYFSSSPNDFSKVDYTMNITKNLASLLGKPLYLESENYNIEQELYQNLQNYTLRIQPACTDAKTCFDNTYPIKDCTNNFIVVKQAENNKVYENDSCIYIEGKQEDLMKLTDITLLKLMGIN